MESLSTIPIRYAETDRMGVVHHSHYPVFFEQGRTDFFLEHVRPYAEFEAQGIFAPVLRLELEILGRATYGDSLLVYTRPDWLKGVRLQMSYRLTRTDGGPVARGSTLHALVTSEMKPVHPRRLGPLFTELSRVFPAGRPDQTSAH